MVLFDTEGSGDVNLNNLIRESVEKKNKVQNKQEIDVKATVDLNELIKEMNEETSQLSQQRLDRLHMDPRIVEDSSSSQQTLSQPSSKNAVSGDRSSTVIKSEDSATKNLYSWDRNRPDTQTPESDISAKLLMEKLEGLTMDSTVDKFNMEELYDPKKYRTHVLPPVLQFPNVGDFMDVHVISISDPGHFLVSSSS